MPIRTMETWSRFSLPEDQSFVPSVSQDMLSPPCYPWGWLLSSPPCPHLLPLPHPQPLAFLWPRHFPKRIRCRGRLAALKGKRVQADVILGAASLTRIGGGGVRSGEQGAQGAGGMGAMGPPAPPALPVYLSGSCTAWPYAASTCPCVCMRVYGGRG